MSCPSFASNSRRQNPHRFLQRVALFLSACFLAVHAHPSSGHHRHKRISMPGSGSHHYIVKFALTECKVPDACRKHVESALLNHTQVPECDAVDYFELLKCLDREILSRTNVTDLNSRAGRVCCEMDEVSLPCQLACRSALFAPTLSHEQKHKRIEMVCHRGHGDEVKGDSGVLNCLAIASEWLPQKHKVRF